jgi:hypothetical protein
MAGSGSGAKPGLLTCVQDPTSPMKNCYWLSASPANNSLALYRQDAGNSVLLESVDVAIDEGTEYILAIALGDEWIKAEMYMQNEKLLAQTSRISDTNYTSGYFGFYTGGNGATAYYDYVAESPITLDTSVEVSTTSDVAQEALDSSMVQNVLSDLNSPSTNTANATGRNGYHKGKSLSVQMVDVPMEYGKLHVRHSDGRVKRVTAELDYSSMPDSLINDISDNFGWSSSEIGNITYDGSFSKPKFVRQTTDSERTDVIQLISDHDSREDDPYGVVVRNRDGGIYQAVYHDKIYHVNEAIDTVVNETKIFQSHSNCHEIGLECWKDISGSWLSCNAATLWLACFAAGPYAIVSCPTALVLCGLSLDSASSDCSEYNECSDRT